ncbi:hypothetical protein SCALIN_C07_0045 [Candidatus Scalindua japonica]|uniref:Uncharacterized protein n=1 Tax=Candidatus Scalindua japonica TaxID=1284222 RepID=A0A286TWI7_9BACT|nr:DUF6208 family protein [Candidatus Scalindua japonica]GAX60234.1 hypothetical protein SCALIN_C07_0045 [Candidatus Scalindua japonica]
MESICLVWRLPLSVLSFFFYRIVRFCLQKVVRKEVRRRSSLGEPVHWLGLSEALKQPMGLVYIMVTGPRWNCSAVIGVLGGSLKVESSIDIQIEAANRSAKQWTLVIYNECHQTVAYVGSMNTAEGTEWQKVNLEEGLYSIGLRYYNCSHDVKFPAVRVDNIERVSCRSMNNEMQEYQTYLKQIENKRGFFYYCLHYYMFHMLRWNKFFSASLVTSEFLPVGNPETLFEYGCLTKGNSLHVDFEADVLDRAYIYLAYYNTCSFPVFWIRIDQTGYLSQTVPCDGYYLIRVVYKNEVESATSSKKIQCKVIQKI